ncbi:MAG: undecaprenyl-phosphate glucose phosphotransferase [Caenispirillum sp.]|nr:undecaprenyl-phosphate glucose phosphotransferase [Caenispirillum sp.]
MFAAIGKQHNLLRSKLSLASTVGLLLDPAVVLCSLAAVVALHEEPFEAPYVILALILFSLTFPGTSRVSSGYMTIIRDVLLGWLILAGLLLLFGYASGYIRIFPQEVVLDWFFATPAALIAANLAAKHFIPLFLAQAAYQRTAVIAGANEVGLRLARQFRDKNYLGVRLLGFFDDRSRERLGDDVSFPLLGKVAQLAEYAKQYRVDLIYLALPMATQPRILNLLDSLRDTTASIYFVPDIFVTDLIQGRMDDVGGLPVVSVCETPFIGINGLVKRTSDIVLAGLILLLISPLMLAIAIGVKLSSPGPVIFKQRRYGLDGKEITVYKFRSMTVCEDGDNVPQAQRNDRRVTRFGAFLRRTSLDELPQFINVLQGRMSVVGPRPHAVAHNEMYRKLIKGYMIRHKVKPGITGLAQVNGLRGETETLDKMKARIECDLDYLRNWSLGLDLSIILRTILVVLRDRNAY